ncbi:MAG: YqgE/AlgH family protein [Pseudomonadota bacterium]|nr:YqgE/AlgH family protein [Pseudomonadota bacterium]
MTTTPPESLKNKFLIAMPSLQDPNFSKTVTYIFEDNDEGTMGIIINQPMDITLAGILEHLEINIPHPELANFPVLRGGPVSREHGFIIHHEVDIGNGYVADIQNHIIISASKEDLITIPQTAYPQILVSLGYAGWGKGQLWEEIAANSWLVAPVDMKILFELPYAERWLAAAKLLGLDFSRLVSDAGHA